MDLVVEGGTGLTNANSWVTPEFAASYHAAVGNKEWAEASGDDQKSYLYRAVVLLIIPRYAGRWKGEIYSKSQSLPWPRADYFSDDGYWVRGPYVPEAIKFLQCEVALSFITNPTQDDPREPGLILKSDKIGPLVETEQFNGQGSATHVPSSPRIARLVRPLLEYGAGQVRIDRS